MGVQYNMKFSYGVKNRTINKIIRDNNNNNYELLTSSMKKLDESQNAILFPPINVNVAKYFYENSPILYKCIHAIAEDTTLGEVSSDDEKLSHFWEKNQDELFYMMLDYLLFGYACAEIITNKKGEVKLLKQIPSYTVHLIKEDDCYYAHQVINSNNVKLQLHGEIYPAEDEADGLCLWIGGDERYEKFSLPRWKSCMNQLASNILVNELNISNVQGGNLLSGVLAVSGGKQFQLEGEASFEDKLKEQFASVGTGLAVSYIENANRDQEIKMEYINLSNNNWDYLKNIYDTNEQDVLECFFIPKERLLNNESKESMNSNKSQILWNIYLRSIQNIQKDFLHFMKQFNKFYFKTDEEINIALPTFEDATSLVIANVKELLNLGLMSKNEAIEYINKQNIDIQLSPQENMLGDMKPL